MHGLGVSRARRLLPAALLGLAACSGSGPVGPDVSTANLVQGATTTLKGVAARSSETVGSFTGRLSPLTQTLQVSRIIGPLGGVIGAADASLVIPRGALAKEVKITMTLPEGSLQVAYFEPHGLLFLTPAQLSWDLSGTDMSKASGDELVGVYRDLEFSEHSRFASTPPREFFKVSVKRGVATHDVPHFSAYSMESRRGYTAAGALEKRVGGSGLVR